MSTARLLVVVQAVDRNDPLNGFFHRWLEVASTQFASIDVLALRVGNHDLPSNVRVTALRPANSKSRLRVIQTLIVESWKRRHAYDAVFVRQDPQYVALTGWLWHLMGKRVVFWYTHVVAGLWFWLAAPCADEIVTAVPESNPLRRALKVGHHIDTEFFCPSLEGNVGESPLRTLVLGRISSIKRVPSIVRAIGSDVGQNMSLRIIGSATNGSAKADLERALPDRSMWEERNVNQREAAELYRNADVFINATPASMDKTILEAAASGCVVLAATKGMLRGLPPDLHWLQWNTEKELHNAFVRVASLTSEERRAIGKRLREWVEREHSLPANVTKIHALLSEAAAPMPSIRLWLKRIAWMVPRRCHAGVSVLMFHAMDGKAAAAWDPIRFCALLIRLSSRGYQFVRPSDVWENGTLKSDDAKKILLTFDDATEDFIDVLPVLRMFRAPAIVFAPVEVRELTTSDGIRRRILSPDSLKSACADGLIEVGGHGATHTRLTDADDQTIHHEAVASMQYVRSIHPNDLPSFAYPFGKVDERVRNAVHDAGFDVAFGVQPGWWMTGTDPLQIPRFPVLGWMTSNDVVYRIV